MALRRILWIYAVLALIVFAFPGGLVSWLDDRNRSGWLDAPLGLMRGVDAVSAAVGLKGVGQRLRKGFAAVVGVDEGLARGLGDVPLACLYHFLPPRIAPITRGLRRP
jgi:hypothetical protein